MGIIRKATRGTTFLATGVPLAHKRSKKDKIVRNTERQANAMEQMATQGSGPPPTDYVDWDAWATYQHGAQPTAPPPQGPPAGWYQDPDGTGTQRWWDGQAWTEHRY